HVSNADDNGTAGIQWYELQKKPGSEWKLNQQGKVSPSSDGRFTSSISINSLGQIALGYNISSSQLFPGIRITGRDKSDLLNTMTNEAIVKAGSSKNGSLKYGDYNGMVADPTDGSFWLTANYNQETYWWTNVVHFAIDHGSLRLNANSLLSQLSVVPNPAADEATISFASLIAGEVSVQIIDIAGKSVLEQTI